MSTPSDRKQAAKGRGERRKAKSRDAARERRGLESTVFDAMLAVLPLPAGCKEQLDKASVVRLAINYVKLRQLLGRVAVTATIFSDESVLVGTSRSSPANTTVCPASEVFNLLHCFLLVLSEAGDVVFVTENISKFIGTTQLDLIGNRIFDFLHPCDHDEIKAMLHERAGRRSSFFSRFRCIQLTNGRVLPSKSAAYKVVKFTGHVLVSRAATGAQLSQDNCDNKTVPDCEPRHLLLTGELIPNPSVEPRDELAEDNAFFSRHSLDMKFTACDEKAQKLVRYDVTTLVGSSLYEYVHGCDCRSMEKFFKSLYAKGQSCTERYRFLCNGGGYVWMVSKASVIINRKSSMPQHVECIHTVVSGVEDDGCVLSSAQCSTPAVASASGGTGNAMGDRTTRCEGGEGCSTIIEDTEALFSELNCRSNTSSQLSSPTARDPVTDDILAAPVDASGSADGKQGDAADDDIYTCTSGLFGDGVFVDSAETLIFEDPDEGLLIDTTCLDEYLEEDMSQRAPYIPMNMASDEVFAADVPPNGMLACTTQPEDGQQGAAVGQISVPPLIALPCPSTSFTCAWSGVLPSSAHSTSSEPLPLLEEVSVIEKYQGPEPLLHPWPAHLQPRLSAGSCSHFGQVQNMWPYPAHNLQPPVAHHSAANEVPRFMPGSVPMIVQEPWALSHHVTFAAPDYELSCRRQASSHQETTGPGREWMPSSFLRTEEHVGTPVVVDRTSHRQPELSIGQYSTWPTASPMHPEGDGMLTGHHFPADAPPTNDKRPAGVKRLAFSPQSGEPPRKTRALPKDRLSAYALPGGGAAMPAGGRSNERASAEDLWHFADVWPGAGEGTSRWRVPDSSMSSITTDQSRSDRPGTAAGFSRQLSATHGAMQLPTIGLEDLLFL